MSHDDDLPNEVLRRAALLTADAAYVPGVPASPQIDPIHGIMRAVNGLLDAVDAGADTGDLAEQVAALRAAVGR